MWKIELEDDYFRIYDSKKNIAGYFDPDYGQVYPQEKLHETIVEMLKNQSPVSGGFVMFPMVKFGIFDSDYESNIDGLSQQLEQVQKRIAVWKEFIGNEQSIPHFIKISHTDQDMLSISFPIKFSRPTPLEKKELLLQLEPILNQLQRLNLL